MFNCTFFAPLVSVCLILRKLERETKSTTKKEKKSQFSESSFLIPLRSLKKKKNKKRCFYFLELVAVVVVVADENWELGSNIQRLSKPTGVLN